MVLEFSAGSDEAPHGKHDSTRQAETITDTGPATNGRSALGGREFPQLTAPPEGEANNAQVLIVDDDEAVRETMADLLEMVGYRPLQAADCQEALTILRQGANIDALVTDLTMPGGDGIMLIRHARALHRDLPVILLTGYAEQVKSVNTGAIGNVHVLRKPVGSRRLIEQLELLVRKPQSVKINRT